MRFVRDFFLTFSTQIVNIPLGLITSVILARTLGPQGRGVLALLILIPNIVTILTSFNIGAANVYYLRKGKISLKEIIRANLILFSVIGSISYVISLILIEFWPDVSLSGLKQGEIFIASLSGFFQLFQNYFNSIVLAYQHMIRYNIVGLSASFFNIILLVIFLLLLGLGIWGVLLSGMFVGMLTLFIIWRNLAVISKDSDISHVACSIGNKQQNQIIKKLIDFGWRSNVNNVLWFLILKSDMLLISILLGSKELGYYAVAVGLAEKLRLIPQAAGIVLFPKAASMSKVSRIEFIASINRFVFWSCAIISLLAIWVVNPFIRVAFSESFMPACGPLKILLIATTILALHNILGYEFVTSGRPEINAYVTGMGLLVNIILNIFMIPRYGIQGAAMTSLLGYGIISVLTLLLVCNRTSVSLTTLVLPQKKDYDVAKGVLTNVKQLIFAG